MVLKEKILMSVLFVVCAALSTAPALSQESTDTAVYDEAAYTDYVASTMQKLDRLYLDFCVACGADAEKAGKAKREFLTTVRDLMQYMNGRFDRLDPKMGAALSPTETLVSIHALTMLVDILTALEIEEMTPHPYNE
ncbi:MAG: hypothetical protein P8X59_00870 [Woeseiaceae bacterium]|jgi:hypothetical protein